VPGDRVDGCGAGLAVGTAGNLAAFGARAIAAVMIIVHGNAYVVSYLLINMRDA
jgi:hypothetical protein